MLKNKWIQVPGKGKDDEVVMINVNQITGLVYKPADGTITVLMSDRLVHVLDGTKEQFDEIVG